MSLFSFIQNLLNKKKQLPSESGQKTKPFSDYYDVNGNLYFSKMSGAGTFTCNACNHQQYVTSFIHGYNKLGRSAAHGCQCQSCGKLTTYSSNEGVAHVIPLCECGGKLKTNKKIFCPVCKSYDVKYYMSILS